MATSNSSPSDTSPFPPPSTPISIGQTLKQDEVQQIVAQTSDFLYPVIERPDERMDVLLQVNDSLEQLILKFEESNVVYFTKHALLNMSADQSDLIDGMLQWCQHPENAALLQRIAQGSATDADRANFLIENPYTCDTVFVVSPDPDEDPRPRRQKEQLCQTPRQPAYLIGHRSMLAARSNVFGTLLGVNSYQLPPQLSAAGRAQWLDKISATKPFIVRRLDVNQSTMHEVLRFLYTGMVNARRRDVIAAMALAAELDLEDMVDVCGSYVLDWLVDAFNACILLDIVCRLQSERCAIFVEHISQFIGEKAVECLGLTSDAPDQSRMHLEPLEGLFQMSSEALSRFLRHAPYISISAQITYLLCLEWAKDKLQIPRHTAVEQLTPEQHQLMHQLLREPLRYVAFEATDEEFLQQVVTKHGFANKKLIAAALQHISMKHQDHLQHLITSSIGGGGIEDPMFDVLSAIHDRSRTFRFELVIPIMGKYESPEFTFVGLKWKLLLVTEVGGWDLYLCLVDIPPQLKMVLVDFVLYLINRSGKGHRIHSVDNCKFKLSDLKWSHQYQLIDSANVNNRDFVTADRRIIAQCAFNRIQFIPADPGECGTPTEQSIPTAEKQSKPKEQPTGQSQQQSPSLQNVYSHY